MARSAIAILFAALVVNAMQFSAHALEKWEKGWTIQMLGASVPQYSEITKRTAKPLPKWFVSTSKMFVVKTPKGEYFLQKTENPLSTRRHKISKKTYKALGGYAVGFEKTFYRMAVKGFTGIDLGKENASRKPLYLVREKRSIRPYYFKKGNQTAHVIDKQEFKKFRRGYSSPRGAR